MWEIIKAIFYGIIEGITEWLPISSTGHLILFEEFFPFKASDSFMEMFRVVIQLGAIMAVVILFFNKLNPFTKSKTTPQKHNTYILWFKVIIACFPAAVIGLAFDDFLDKYLYKFIPVALMLILYGVLFILLENRNRKYNIQPKVNSLNQISYQTALIIGAFQILALIPGTSRSGITILGAVFIGCSRTVAAEFSFFLAIPVMFGASALKVAKLGLEMAETGLSFTTTEITVLITGIVVSFIVSVFAIKFLMNFIKRHDFKVFGVYRIIIGIILLIYAAVR